MSRPEVVEFVTTEIVRLTRFVRRRMEGLGAVEAEDVVQDVALRLFALPDVARPVENMAAYVFSSLQNRIADLWRRQRRRPEIDSEQGALERLAIPAVGRHTLEFSRPAGAAGRRGAQPGRRPRFPPRGDDGQAVQTIERASHPRRVSLLPQPHVS